MYKDLTAYYEDFFPLQKDLAHEFVSRWPDSSLLDVGCGTGLFIQFLQQNGYLVKGREYTQEMAEKAREKGLSVSIGGFSGLDEIPSGWDHISCLGNTLPHVSGVEELGIFFSEAQKKLSERGILHIQTIRFDTVKKSNPQGFDFPDLHAADVLFKRNYSWRTDGFIDFNTQLVKAKEIIMSERVLLMSLSREMLIEAAGNNGLIHLESSIGDMAEVIRFKRDPELLH